MTTVVAPDYFAAWTQENAPKVRMDDGALVNIADTMATAVGACRELVSDTRKVVFLWGSYGNGKSHLAKCCIRAFRDETSRAREEGLDVDYPILLVVPDWLSGLRRLSLADSEKAESEIEAIQCNSSLVGLDDWGVEPNTDWTRDKIYRVVNFRCEHRLPLMVTSNALLSDLDPRIVSRLREGKVVCDSPDVRGRI